MTDEIRKRLTEKVLGECWHERSSVLGKCIHCGRVCNRVTSMDHRSFTTDKDAGDLVRALAKKGEFKDFLHHAWLNGDEFDEGTTMYDGSSNTRFYDSAFIAMLITDPARTCDLIGEWMEARQK